MQKQKFSYFWRRAIYRQKMETKVKQKRFCRPKISYVRRKGVSEHNWPVFQIAHLKDQPFYAKCFWRVKIYIFQLFYYSLFRIRAIIRQAHNIKRAQLLIKHQPLVMPASHRLQINILIKPMHLEEILRRLPILIPLRLHPLPILMLHKTHRMAIGKHNSNMDSGRYRSFWTFFVSFYCILVIEQKKAAHI